MKPTLMVEADHQQVIDRVGHLLVVVEGLEQKDPPVLVQRARDPGGHRDADNRVEDVDPDSGGHTLLLSQKPGFNLFQARKRNIRKQRSDR